MSGLETSSGERVACTGCPLVCVDVVVCAATEGVDSTSVSFGQACSRGVAWLSEAWSASDREMAVVEGRACGADEAAEAAAGRLAACRRVLVTGCNDATLETVLAAADLAEGVKGAVDFGAADTRHSIGPIQSRYGRVTADFEELRDRADCVVLWCGDLEQSHPRFVERFVAPPTLAGPRRVFVIGDALPPSATPGWTLVDVPRTQLAEVAATWRRMLRERLSGKAAFASVSAPRGVTLLEATLTPLIDACEAAQCIGVVTEPSPDDRTGVAAAAVSQLVNGLAHHKPAFEIPLAAQAQGAGGAAAAAVCTWRFGASGAVAVADRNGGPTADAEADACRLISRGEVDGVVVVGEPTPPVAAALEGYEGCVVAVGGAMRSSGGAVIWIATKPTSLATQGTVLRGDGTLVELREVRPSARPAAQTVLTSILHRLAVKEGR